MRVRQRVGERLMRVYPVVTRPLSNSEELDFADVWAIPLPQKYSCFVD